MKQAIRPSNLNSFVGKEDIKNLLSISIKACKIKKQTMSHSLFYGPPGTGKTSLAFIIANELNSRIKIVQGPNLQKPIDIINLVMSIREGDIIFIDEIHQIAPSCMEMLYPIMEDFAFDINVGKDFNSKITRIKIPKFTLIGATTMLGKIPNPFQDRFTLLIALDLYTNEEIVNILLQIIKGDPNIEIPIEHLKAIALHAKGTPRIAINILKYYIDYITVYKSVSDIKKFFRNIGLYQFGLNQNDIAYLKMLSEHTNQNIGLKLISQVLGYDMATIENKIEPFLLKKSFIKRTKTGRLITENGINYLLELN